LVHEKNNFAEVFKNLVLFRYRSENNFVETSK